MAGVQEQWNLMWHDEFDSPLLDEQSWEFQTGTGTEYGLDGWGNQELQYYTRDNIDIADGVLSIIARAEERGGSRYTSSRLVTARHVDFSHGRLEFRARLPSTHGMWSALWLMPTDPAYGGWPHSGEIDVMEYAPMDAATGHDVVAGTIHTGAYVQHQGHQHRLATSDFQTYELRWEQDCLEMSAGGERFFVYRNTGGSEVWPFDKPFHVIMNLAVGGTLGGEVASDAVPSRMEVDYVRLYQRANGTFASPCEPCAPPAAVSVGAIFGIVFLCCAAAIFICSRVLVHKRQLPKVLGALEVAGGVIAVASLVLLACVAALVTSANFCVEGPLAPNPSMFVDGRIGGSFVFGSWLSIALNGLAALVGGSTALLGVRRMWKLRRQPSMQEDSPAIDAEVISLQDQA